MIQDWKQLCIGKYMKHEHDIKRLLEPEIKALILNHLQKSGEFEKKITVISEFTLRNFSRRVDLVIAKGKRLIAFEIKSEADSLTRLQSQIDKDIQYFDKVIVVAATKHIDEILVNTPENVGVWEVTNQGLKTSRRGKTLPIKNKIKLLDLMKASELLQLCNQLKISYSSNNRHSLETVLLKAPMKSIREAAIGSINKRFQTTSSLFLEKIDKKAVDLEDISLLSPYKKDREALKASRTKKEKLWNNWKRSSAEDPYLDAISKEDSGPIFGEVPKEIKDLLENKPD